VSKAVSELLDLLDAGLAKLTKADQRQVLAKGWELLDERRRLLRPVADPSETLALIAEHRLTLAPHNGGWWVTPPDDAALLVDDRAEYGATIGDAVRACVARIKE
jgi:hypothetical protein